MIRVSIQGSKEEAEKALQSRNIPGNHLQQLGLLHMTSVWEIDETYKKVLHEWYCEPLERGVGRLNGYLFL